MKRIAIVLAAAIIVALAFWAGRTYMTRSKQAGNPHFHAGFRVYADGILQDYSDLKYMHIEPCTKDAHRDEKKDGREMKAHLHDGIGDVVHVHRNGAVWRDLFTNIHVTFPAGEPIQGYIGGKPVADILAQPISAYESVVIVVGNSAGVLTTEAVTVDHIRAAEKRSESCGS